MRRGGRLFYAAAPSQVYAEVKRLHRSGHLTAHTAPGRTRPRTVYELSDSGRAALTEWVRAPTRYPRLQHDATTRLLVGELVSDAELLNSLEHLQTEIADRRDLLAALEERQADRAPKPRRNRELGFSLGRRLLDAHEEWLAEVRATLGRG